MTNFRISADKRCIASALAVVGAFIAAAMAITALAFGLEHAGLIQLDAIAGQPVYKLQ